MSDALPPPRVVIVSRAGPGGLPAGDLSRLARHADVQHVRREAAMQPGDAVESFRGADVVAVTPLVSPLWTARLLDELPRLRGLAVYATGLDFLDLELLADRGVEVAHLPSYSSVAVAEHALGLILTLSRRIHLANDRSRGRVEADVSLRGFELAGRTLGVVGVGRIGARVGRLGAALGMNVLGTEPLRLRRVGIVAVTLDELLRRSDVVSLNLSLTPGQTPLIGTAQLAKMRPGAILVNVSRAALVDHDAVAASIRAGHLRGYAVDDEVFDRDRDVDLLEEGRVVQTGHSAWWADEVLERGGRAWIAATEALVKQQRAGLGATPRASSVRVAH